MPNSQIVGSATIQLVLDRSRLDRDVQLLQQLNVRPIAVGVQIDQQKLSQLKTDLQKQLRELNVGIGFGSPQQQGSNTSSRKTGVDSPDFKTNAALTAQRVREEIAAQKEIEKEAQQSQKRSLEREQITNAQKLTEIKRAESAQVQAVQLALKTQEIDQAEAARRIQAINKQTSEALIQESRRRLQVTEQLQQQGIISERQAADQTLQIEQRISAQRQQLAKLAIRPNNNPVAASQGSPIGGGIFEGLNKFQEATANAARFAIGMKALSDQLTQAGGRLTSFSGQASQAFKDFDDQVTKVSTIPGTNADELATKFKNLSAELNYQTNATQLLAGSYQILSVGFTKTNEVAEVSRAGVLASKGGYAEYATTIDGLTATLKAYGEGADKAGQYADKFAQIQNSGKTTIKEFVGDLGKIAPLAAGAGVSFDELGAIVATATSQGVKTNEAITGVGAALQGVIAPSEQAVELAAKLNDRYKGLNLQFNETGLRADGFAGILKKLKSVGADSGVNIKTLFGNVEAIKTLAPVLSDLDAYEKTVKDISTANGTAAAAADKVANSFSGRLNRAFNETNTALVDLGKGAAGVGSALLIPLTFLVENFIKLPDPIKQAAGVALALSGGMLTLAGTLAGVAAIFPVLESGFGILGSLLGLDAIAAAANTAATEANAVAHGSVSSSIAGEVASLGASTTALEANTAATAAGTAGLAGMAANLLGVGVAIAAIGVAVDTFNTVENSAASTQQKIDDLSKAIADLDNSQKSTADSGVGLSASLDSQGTAAKSFYDKLNPVQQLLENVRSGLASLPAPLQKILLGLPGLATGTEKFATAGEAAINKQKEKYAELTNQVDGVLDRYQRFTQTGEKSAEATNAQREAIEKAKKALEESNPVDEAGATAKRQYTAALDRALASLDKISPASKTAAQGIKTVGDSAAEARLKMERLDTNAKNKTTTVQETEDQDLQKIRQQISDRNKTKAEGEVESQAILRKSAIAQIAITEEQLAGVKQLRDKGSISEIEATNKISDLTSKLAGLKKRAAEAELAGIEAVRQKRIEDLELANKQAEATISLAQTTRSTATKQRIAGGELTQEQADLQNNSSESQATQASIDLVKKELAQTRQLEAEKVIDKKTATEQQIALNQKLAEANNKLIDLELQRQQELRAAIQKTLDRREQGIKLAESQANLTGQKQEVDQLTGSKLIDRRSLELGTQGTTLSNRAKSLNQEVAATQEAIAALDALKLKDQSTADQRRELEQKLTDLQAQQIEARKQLELNAEEQATRAIEQKAAIQKSSSELAIAQLEKEKSALETVSATIDQQTKLLEVKSRLQKAQFGLSTTGTESQIDIANQALELRKQIDSEQDPRKRGQLERALSQTGFQGQSEVEILRKKQDLERQLFEQKRRALLAEQAVQKQLTELELKKSDITARNAVNEAKLGELKAKQAIDEANIAIAKARANKDAEGTILAQQQLQIAQATLESAKGRTSQASDAYAAQQDYAAATRQAVQAEQRNAAAELGASQRALRVKQAVELAQVNPSTGVSGAASGGAIGRAVSNTGRVGANVSGTGNSDVVGAIGTLRESINQLANTPRSLSFSTPDPVDDYARYNNENAIRTLRNRG